MQGHWRPLFTKGRVVKKESLDCLEQFPRELAELAWNEYSDGILHGFDLDYRDGVLKISAGAVHDGGDILLFPEQEVPFLEYGKPVIVKICLGERQRTEDFVMVPTGWKVDQSLPVEGEEMEIGRFCLSEGAVLRKEYQGMRDVETVYNTLNLIHVKYAGVGKATMAPVLMRLFGEELFSSGTSHPMDVPFAFLCMNSGLVQKECVERYLSGRLLEKSQELTNEEIYRRMIRVLSSVSAKETVGNRAERRGPSIV